ncbi:methylated-DNA--[protein]-cysteine S-methyltransferase [Maribellus maritimus]|uniref:methylated-DNA--[protein]-cysteine S-methyltransferase n=1 Tax=Maribellus maritimus TaxID=2870838 RepID=UPI001EEB3DC3|nr:methylated-DNA--[protein]-cysteine S-methyltransferase [Maribellus maritimus]MCG6188875.1 methylated-DNA--[protein]-cysteine S-methyltransferase [Maribellus maritimus]
MEEKLYITFLESPVGWLKLTSDSVFLLSVEFKDTQKPSDNDLPEILIKTKKQLTEYFEGKRKKFRLKLKPKGTDFQQKVWNLVQEVSFGETASYLDIAKISGSEKNTRAVGLANGKNPIPIIIPCHRIIGSNGKLTGYAGGIERKKWLLRHELILSKNTQLLF